MNMVKVMEGVTLLVLSDPHDGPQLYLLNNNKCV